MLRQIDETPLDEIVVDVFQLLAHHQLALDTLRVATFLPELVLGVGLVPTLEQGQQRQESMTKSTVAGRVKTGSQ
jgi:hypothetical protein